MLGPAMDPQTSASPASPASSTAPASGRTGLWVRLAAYYACGVFAAAQIGKLATLAPAMQRDLGLALSTMAILIALIEAGGALLGVRAGALAQRLGLVRTLLGAMALLAAASAGEALAGGAAALLGWRLVEAAGYVGVIVSAPVLMANDGGAQRAPTLLTVWSTFVPVGLAVGAWAHGAIADVYHWRAAIGASAAVALLLGLATAATQRHAGTHAAAGTAQAPAGDHDRAALPPEAWILAAAFGAFAVLGIGAIALLPTVLVEGGLTLGEAGVWSAWAAFAMAPGSLAAGLFVHRPSWHRGLCTASLLAGGLLTYVMFGTGATPMVVGLAAVAMNAVLGVFSGLAFALLPGVAGGPQRTARAYGALAQFGASGSLAGPPLMAAAAEHGGWRATAVLGFALAVVSLGLALRALPRKAQ